MEKLNLVSPWINFYHEVEALFRNDHEVTVKFDDENYELKLFVDNAKKGEAIEYILPHEKIFGNVTVKITVIPANKPISGIDEALAIAFKGNPVFGHFETVSSPFGDMNYAVFLPYILQYFNDDIGDIDGKRTATIEDIAKEVLSLGDAWHICSDRKYDAYNMKNTCEN